MTKPHEGEEWLADGRTLRLNADDAAHTLAVFEWHGSQINLERARLAAAAPAMARLLLSRVDNADPGRDAVNFYCFACSRGGSHDPDCELIAVLRAAGVLE